MFGLPLQARIKSVASRVRDCNGILLRTSVLALELEFSTAVAAKLGADAVQLQTLIADGGVKSAAIDLEAPAWMLLGEIGAAYDNVGEFTARLQQLTVKAPADVGEQPMATVRAQFSTDDETILWCLHHLEETVLVRIEHAQLGLPGAEGEATK